MEVKVAGALENSVRSVRSGRKIQILSVVILVFGAVVVAGWFAWRRFSAVPMWRAFSGARAFGDLQNVVKFGPRPPGSSALEETREYISMGLAANGIEVWHDNFTAATPAGDIAMTNVIGIISGETPSVAVVGGIMTQLARKGRASLEPTTADPVPGCCWSWRGSWRAARTG